MASYKQNRVTYEELSEDFSHYEIVLLSFCRASDILLSARSILGNNQYKPKVAVVAFNEICNDVEGAKSYRKELIQRASAHYSETDSEDHEVDEGYEIPDAEN